MINTSDITNVVMNFRRRLGYISAKNTAIATKARAIEVVFVAKVRPGLLRMNLCAAYIATDATAIARMIVRNKRIAKSVDCDAY